MIYFYIWSYKKFGLIDSLELFILVMNFQIYKI